MHDTELTGSDESATTFEVSLGRHSLEPHAQVIVHHFPVVDHGREMYKGSWRVT